MNKRIKSLALAFLMVLSTLATAVPVYAVSAEAPITVTIEHDVTIASPGNTINYTVYVGPIQKFQSANFTLIIPTGLTYDSGEAVAGLAGQLGAEKAEYTDSTKTMVIYGEGSYTSDTKTALMTFSCTVNDGTEGKTLKITFDSDADFADDSFETYDTTYDFESSNVTITGAPSAALGGTIAIQGEPKFNKTLSINLSSLTGNSNPATLQYQWLRNDAGIAGATNATYTLAAADVGKNISVKVTSSAETGAVTSTSVTVGKADKTAPTGVTAGNCTTPDNNDGKITGVTTDMEYKKAGDSTYKAISGDEVKNLVPGSYHIRYKETETHSASPDATVTIAAFTGLPSASVATDPTANTLTYNGAQQELVTAGAPTGGAMQYSLNGTDWSGSIPKGKDAKSYTVYYMVKGDGSHSDSAVKSITVTIDPKDISSVTVEPITAVTYDGNKKTPAPVVKDNGETLALNTDYTVSYSNNTNAGSSATVTIKGKGNYGGQRDVTFTINKAVQTITVPTAPQTVSFDNTLDLNACCSSNAPGATLTFAVKGGSTAPIGTSLSGSTVTAGNTAGTFIVTVNSAAVTNYEAAAAKEFTVKIVNLPAASVTTAPAVKTDLVYNGTEQALITAGVASDGTMQYKLGSGSYGSELPKAENAGTYTVYYKAKGDSAHSDSAEQSLTVTIGKRAATVAPKSFTITKGSAIPTFGLAYTGLVSGDTLTPSTTPTFTCFESDGSTEVSTSTPAGNYTITWTNEGTTLFTDADNYDLTKTATATLTISNPSGGGGGGVATYTITVESAKNGTITAFPKTAPKGSTVTITVKPDKGYKLDTLKVLDSKDQALKLTEKDGKYTFTMPAGKVTVKGSFAAEATEIPEVPEQIFADVSVDAYYYEAVKWAADKGITGGVGGDLFAPDQPCTRAQIVTFLWRAAGSPAPKSMSSFADVPTDAYYAKAVAWAVENGITSGTGNGKFSPDAVCTRAQCVTFLYRAAGSPAVSGSAAFTDVKADAYYADAVAWADEKGITTGIGGGLFGSDNDCTRAQIVTFLYRYMEK